MIERKYLLWFDILGFEKLAEEIAEKKGLAERKIRDDFVNVIKERVGAIEAKGEIIGKNYGERDDWMVVTPSLESVFRVICEILDHNTGYENYERIPLEIAIGVGEYDRWARFEGTKFIIEKPTIEFLKAKIVTYYHNWYKQNHNNESPKFTFIVLTKSCYDALEPLDKKLCQRIEYKYKNKGEEVITLFIADPEKVQQRGKIFEFLEKIKRPGSRLYDRIYDLHVPPLEYEEIKDVFKTARIVFITGTAEYGKTYTAVRLLWEYYNQGYEPIWVAGGESLERWDVRKRLEEIEKELKPHQVIYFEDPFGKIRYEGRESLEREIGTIMESVRNVEDVYVIITSREEVFKEFEKEQLSSVEIKQFERKLSIKKPSYDYAKRKEILLRWAEAKGCRWFEDNYLRDLVSVQIKDERKLPTPLSIKDFVYSTLNIVEKNRLMEKIEEKSKETAKSFAEEIENMTDDKILFLSFPFISNFPTGFVRGEYEKLVKELEIEEPMEFDEVLSWFKDDKIVISVGTIMFSHPSYFEALKCLLVKEGRLTRINKGIFCKVLLKLADKERTASTVVLALALNFDSLPVDVRNLLFKFAERNVTAKAVVWVLGRNFSRLPKDVRNELVFKLADKERTASTVTRIVAHYFSGFSEDVRNKLLFKLSERAEGSLMWFVNRNFEKLSEDTRNKLLLKLAEKDDTAYGVARIVALNFDRLPEDVRNELLFKLAVKDKAKRIVTGIVVHYFDRVPREVKNLLDELQFHLQQILIDFCSVDYRKTDALDLISKARSKLNEDFVLEILEKLSKDRREKVRIKAQELMVSVKKR